MSETIILIVIWLLPTASIAWLVIRNDKKLKEYSKEIERMYHDIRIQQSVIRVLHNKIDRLV